MNDPIVAALITVIIMLLVGFPVHEFMHAWTAYRLGDNTARWQGRLTLDPRVHFDTFGGLVLVFTAVSSAAFGGGLLFGWAKPTPVNPMNIRNGRRGEALVSFAGPLSNLVIAAIVAIPMRIVLEVPDLRFTVLFESDVLRLLFDVGLWLLTINILLFVFNLLPIPPLDGWRALMGVVPSDIAYRMRDLEYRYANMIPLIFFGVIFIMLFSGVTFLGDIINFITDLLLGL